MFLALKIVVRALLIVLFPIAVFSQGNAGGESPAWLEIENKMSELGAKIKTQDGNLRNLIRQKQAVAADSPLVPNLIKDIKNQHTELENTVKEYERQKSILKYRFPNRGAQADRRYQKTEVVSVEEVERAVSIDTKLDRNLESLKKHYGANSAGKATGPTPTTIPVGSSIEDQEPITLQK